MEIGWKEKEFKFSMNAEFIVAVTNSVLKIGAVVSGASFVSVLM